MERIDHMQYLPGMEQIDHSIMDRVLAARSAYDAGRYTAADVERALSADPCTPEDFAALLSPAAAPYLEQMARRGMEETRRHFGNSIYMITPL